MRMDLSLIASINFIFLVCVLYCKYRLSPFSISTKDQFLIWCSKFFFQKPVSGPFFKKIFAKRIRVLFYLLVYGQNLSRISKIYVVHKPETLFYTSSGFLNLCWRLRIQKFMRNSNEQGEFYKFLRSPDLFQLEIKTLKFKIFSGSKKSKLWAVKWRGKRKQNVQCFADCIYNQLKSKTARVIFLAKVTLAKLIDISVVKT